VAKRLRIDGLPILTAWAAKHLRFAANAFVKLGLPDLLLSTVSAYIARLSVTIRYPFQCDGAEPVFLGPSQFSTGQHCRHQGESSDIVHESFHQNVKNGAIAASPSSTLASAAESPTILQYVSTAVPVVPAGFYPCEQLHTL
jgi:hypothetical protein